MGNYAPRIKEDKTGKSHDTVMKVIKCDLSKKLYGLLCHYCYWYVLHPWARNIALTAATITITPQTLETRETSGRGPKSNHQSDLPLPYANVDVDIDRYSSSEGQGQRQGDVLGASTHSYTSGIRGGGGGGGDISAMSANSTHADNSTNNNGPNKGPNSIDNSTNNNAGNCNSIGRGVSFTSFAEEDHINNDHDNDNASQYDLRSISSLQSDASLGNADKEQLFLQVRRCLCLSLSFRMKFKNLFFSLYWCTGGVLFHVEWFIRYTALVFFYRTL